MRMLSFCRGILFVCLLELNDCGNNTQYRARRKHGGKILYVIDVRAEYGRTEKIRRSHRTANRGDENIKRLEKIYEDYARRKSEYSAYDPEKRLAVQKFNLGPFESDEDEYVHSRVKAAARTDEENRKLVKRPRDNPTEDSASNADYRSKVNPLGKSLYLRQNQRSKHKVAERTATDSGRGGELHAKDAVAVKCEQNEGKAKSDYTEEGARHLLINADELL